MSTLLDWLARHARRAGFAIMATLALSLLMLDRGGHLDSLEWPLRDALMRELRSQPEPVANDVIVVAFDEAYLAGAREPLALFHGHLATTLETLASLQPAVIGVDFALPEKSFRFLAPRDQPEQDFDRLLLAGLVRSARQVPVILAATLDESGGRYRTMLPEYLSAVSLSPALQRLGLDPRGSVILCPDGDGMIRRYPDQRCRGGPGALPSLAASMAAAQGMRMQPWQGGINFLAGPAASLITVQDLLAKAATPAGRDELLRRIRGKAVLLGAVLDYEDRHRIPVALQADNLRSQQVPGILVQAQIYRSLMNQGLLRPMSLTSVWPGLLIALLLWFGRRHALKLALLALSGLLLVLLAREGLQRGVTLPVTTLWLTAALAWTARWLLDLRHQHKTRRHLAEAFAGATSPALLRHLESHDVATLSRARHAPVVMLGLRLDGGLAGEQASAILAALGDWQHQLREIADHHDGLMESGAPDRRII
ncbi:MAG: CHASE2 domain-containing protein, partial [Perlucidibaca sp.]